MSIAQSLSNQNVYGVTYATVDGSGIHFESELAIQLSDGTPDHPAHAHSPERASGYPAARLRPPGLLTVIALASGS